MDNPDTMPTSKAPRMCCTSCGAAGLPILGRIHTVTDIDGRAWLFESHRMFGPIVLRKDGQPKSRQPGSRSTFWPAWDAWYEQKQAAKAAKDEVQG